MGINIISKFKLWWTAERNSTRNYNNGILAAKQNNKIYLMLSNKFKIILYVKI
jgi:hypothetical protein